MAIFAFDGTTCTPADLSNVFKMYDAYDSRHKYYATGPGSRGTFLTKGFESVSGFGGKDRIKDALEIWEYWQSRGGRETIIVGFSRGAVIAREFANQISEKGGKVDFLGIFDSVGSFGNPLTMMNIGYRKNLESGIAYCAHALSKDEERFTFRVLRANPVEGNTQTAIHEEWFPGVHSDIGGTSKQHGLGNAALNWIYEHAFHVNPKQWAKDALQETKENVNCKEKISSNQLSLPIGFLKSYRTRKIAEDDQVCCKN